MSNKVFDILTGKQALERLMAGNNRYVTAKQTHPDQTPERRIELRAGQNPFAVILGCADSRVPPEVIFDQGLGDLFVVRVAGNILDDIVLASLEYAVIHLRTPLIMVLGHSKCGAVGATVTDGKQEGHLFRIISAIQPALEKAKGRPGDLIENTAKANAKMVAEQLECSGVHFNKLVKAGKLMVVAAYYDLVSGAVEIL